MDRGKFLFQEIHSGINVVREYFSPSGLVFAVTWSGVAPPDLPRFLNIFLTEYQEGLRRSVKKVGQRSRVFETDRMVAENWGHMRKLQGRVFVPSLIPAGVSVDEIK